MPVLRILTHCGHRRPGVVAARIEHRAPFR